MGARKWSPKQIRYLWAIGFFKKSPNSKTSGSDQKELILDRSESKRHWEEIQSSYPTLDNPAHIRGVSNYVGATSGSKTDLIGSNRINGSLRGNFQGERDQASVDQAIRDLDSSMVKSLKESTVFRGIADYPGLDLSPGTVLSDKGFVSTSTNPRSAANFVPLGGDGRVFRIKLPTGTRSRLVPAGLTGSFVDENEIILPRGSYFRVKESSPLFMRLGSLKIDIIDLELIQKEN